MLLSMQTKSTRSYSLSLGLNAECSSRFAFRACDPKPLVLVALLPKNLSVTTGLAFVSLLVSLALIFLVREKTGANAHRLIGKATKGSASVSTSNALPWQH